MLPFRTQRSRLRGISRCLTTRRRVPTARQRSYVPVDAKIEWIYALKPGLGFDYAEYGPIDEQSRTAGGTPATNLPGSVNLTLDGVRTARIKAVDSAGKPLAGVGFYVWLIHKEGRRSQVNVASRLFAETTGPDGIATFDWLPPSKDLLQFWPVDQNYAKRRVTVEAGQTGPVTAKLSPERNDPWAGCPARRHACIRHGSARLREWQRDREWPGPALARPPTEPTS